MRMHMPPFIGHIGKIAVKLKAVQIEMHLRLTFPSGAVCFPHVLQPRFEFGYPAFEASSSSLQRVSFSPEQSSVREKSVGWFSCAVCYVAKWRQSIAWVP